MTLRGWMARTRPRRARATHPRPSPAADAQDGRWCMAVQLRSRVDRHLDETPRARRAAPPARRQVRRAELSPRTVGLPETSAPRRVAGLRREEVAQLASTSTDYSTRLEQGRMQASAPVLDVLARVLHLDDDQAGAGVPLPARR